MPENPNPQGKGLTPVLDTVARNLPRHILRPKKLDQIEMELFTSLFVLQSRFSFEPVPEKDYWMYLHKGQYVLSMISPSENGELIFSQLIGECRLHPDRTWTLILDPVIEQDKTFMKKVADYQNECRDMLEKQAKLQDAMPVYNADLGFYGRILAYTLGRSLDISMQLSGIASLGYQEAKGLLENDQGKSKK